MDRETAERLLTLNREFYATFARPFAASRLVSDPALVCILHYIPQCASVLDVGCGNGRLALLLDQERPGATHLGVDTVPELVALARAQAEAQHQRSPVLGTPHLFIALTKLDGATAAALRAQSHDPKEVRDGLLA